MHHKHILLTISSPEVLSRVEDSLETLDAERWFCVPADLSAKLLRREYDLTIVDLSTKQATREMSDALGGEAPSLSVLLDTLEEVLAVNRGTKLLIMVQSSDLDDLRLPVKVESDFVLVDATDAEIAARVKHLLWPGEEGGVADIVYDGQIALNLATYQVRLDGEPLNLTFLEYALLAFLITHPGKTYSRDALLQRVWDFDYLGGSRTVDVHVRRLRSKLGLEMSRKLETVRGFGYLWNAD